MFELKQLIGLIMFSRNAYFVAQVVLIGCNFCYKMLDSAIFFCSVCYIVSDIGEFCCNLYNNAVSRCLLFRFLDPGTKDFTDDTIEGRTMRQCDRSFFLSFVFLVYVA